MTYPPTAPRYGRATFRQLQDAVADIVDVLGAAPQGASTTVQARIAAAEDAGGGGPVAAADITDATAAGIALITAANAGAQRTAMGVPATSHTHTADDISDATTIGKTVAKAADAAAVRTALGLGTLATQSGTFSGTSSGTNTGDQTVTLTGDVTGTGTGSFAATIAAGAVTYAKMQDVSATDKVLGRSTAGSGDVEEIACTAAGRALIAGASASAQRTTLGSTTIGDAMFIAANLAAALAAIGEQRVRTSSSFNCSSNVTPVDVTGMAFTLAANKTYHFQVNFSTSASAATTTGIQVGFSLPASATMMAIADVPQGADGTAACFRGTLSSGTDYVIAASKNAASGAGVISGTIVTGANAGTAQMRILSEVNTSQVTIESGAVGWCKEVP